MDSDGTCVVRWSDEGGWAHVAFDHGDGRPASFIGFTPLSDDLQRTLHGLGVVQDDAGMWEARLPAARGEAA